MDEDRTSTRLVVLAVVGFALFNYPLLRIADVEVHPPAPALLNPQLDGRADMIFAQAVSGNYFDALGVVPAAALTIVANALLNHDEAYTKR